MLPLLHWNHPVHLSRNGSGHCGQQSRPAQQCACALPWSCSALTKSTSGSDNVRSSHCLDLLSSNCFATLISCGPEDNLWLPQQNLEHAPEIFRACQARQSNNLSQQIQHHSITLFRDSSIRKGPVGVHICRFRFCGCHNVIPSAAQCASNDRQLLQGFLSIAYAYIPICVCTAQVQTALQ